MDLVVAVYELTGQYPKTELYSLTRESRRSAISIPSNIAEGRHRSTQKGFRLYLVRAFASGAELETQIEIAKRLPFSQELNFSKVDKLLDEVMRMLNKMTNELRS